MDDFEISTETFTGYSEKYIDNSTDTELEFTGEWYCNPNSYSQTSTLVHVLCVTFIVLIGTIGNGIVLYIYITKQSNSVGKIYITTLTFLDLYDCVFNITQYPLLGYYVKHCDWIYNRIYQTSLPLTKFSHLSILTASAIDRIKAVFTPYKYKNNWKSALIVCISIMTINLCIFSLSRSFRILGFMEQFLFPMFLSTAPIFLIIAYPMLAIKLMKQKTKVAPVKITVQPKTNTTVKVKIDRTKPPVKPSNAVPGSGPKNELRATWVLTETASTSGARSTSSASRGVQGMDSTLGKAGVETTTKQRYRLMYFFYM